MKDKDPGLLRKPETKENKAEGVIFESSSSREPAENVLGEALYGWRREQGLNTREAASVIGISQTGYSHLESGRRTNPRNATQQKIRTYFTTSDSQFSSGVIEAIASKKILPPEAGMLGKMVRDFRKTSALTLKEMAALAGVSVRTLINIEKGERNPSKETTDKLTAALDRYPRYLNLKEIPEELEGSGKWWRILLDKDLSRGEKLQAIRLSQNDSQKVFVERSGIGLSSMNYIEHDRHKQLLPTINLFIDSINIDTESKAAQYIRLLATETPLMSIEQDTLAISNLIRYIRIVRGHRQYDLGKLVGKSRRWIVDIEGNKYSSTEESTLNPIIDALEIDSDLTEIVRQRVKGEYVIVTHEIKQQLVNGQILFAEYVEDIRRYLALEPEKAHV